MSTAVLLLNVDRTPIKVIAWQRAVRLVLDDKVEVVVGYAHRVVRSMALVLAFPAVVALKRYARVRAKVKFSREHVLARDGYRCAYCGARPRTHGRPDLASLTIDHIVPRSRAIDGRVTVAWSGEPVHVTSWLNVVTACYECNTHKAARTPDEARMPLLYRPTRPGPWDALRIHMTKTRIPDEWKAHLPAGSDWAGYWDDELS